MNNLDVTLLSKEDIDKLYEDGIFKPNQGISTDLTNIIQNSNDMYFTSTDKYDEVEVAELNHKNTNFTVPTQFNNCAIRPVMHFKDSFDRFLNGNSDKIKNIANVNEIDYCMYPQNAAPKSMGDELDRANYKLKDTNRRYTLYKMVYNNGQMVCLPVPYVEFEYKGKYYIRVTNQFEEVTLQNKSVCPPDSHVWIEVSPIRWLIDYKNKRLISKNLLLSGVPFIKDGTKYNGDFTKTTMYDFLNNFMVKDILQTKDMNLTNTLKPFQSQSSGIGTYHNGQHINGKRHKHYVSIPPNTRLMDNDIKSDDLKIETKEEDTRVVSNPYNFNISKVSEEDIIKGAIESNIPVYLHGKSSDGKSARVKEIDPGLTIIYLANATPESLNGKSAYNQSTGEMIDIKPTWLTKLEEKCTKEPDKLHILFFDELSNSLPRIQNMAFNIVLDREVNGIWTLPENARIVAAGNEIEDSLAANDIAQPLFNRFAHVYIKTTTDEWLKWAVKNHIHPAIYTFIASNNGKLLRTKYDGEKPNADPRKWEMASKMLYKTHNPKMLRALVGEEVTNEFIKYCNQEVIPLSDVLSDNYTDYDLDSLDIYSSYATILNLLQVDEENVEKVRKFITKLDRNLLETFDTLWISDNKERLELITRLDTKKEVKRYE